MYNNALGISTFHESLEGPASITAIDMLGFSDNRFARTHPAEPAPTIT